jgi:putative peptidoglycan lipid II flippase
MLPVSLFGMSVSAAELPAMSSAAGDESEIAAHLRRRLQGGLRQIAFFIVPSSMAFLALGDVIAAAVLQSGRFTRSDAIYVWGILAGSTVGLLATTMGRLYSSAYYALRDTRTPLRYAVVRVVLTTALGYVAALWVPRWTGIEERWGVAGLTASAGVAGWIEFYLLRRKLKERIGAAGIEPAFLARLWLAAGIAAAAAWMVKMWAPVRDPIVQAVAVLGAFGLVYFALAWSARPPGLFGRRRAEQRDPIK